MRCIREAGLQSRNTLAVPSVTERLVEVAGLTELLDVLEQADREQCSLFVLGGGSNVVLPDRIDGLVLQPKILGKEIIARDADVATVKVGAGEDWHSLVRWCLEHRLYGLENLALIPGTVGAAPVQNVGAYGVEVAEFIESVEVVYRAGGRRELLPSTACEFAYRDSIFKRRLRDQCVILSVTFQLSAVPQPNLSYPVLQHALRGLAEVTPVDVFNAVCAVRRDRLPNPKELPNAGSFFKNPLISLDLCQVLLARYPELVAYPAPVPQQRKLAAGWLIDQAGWKGMTRYGVQVHDRQALVLTNPQRRSGRDVVALAGDIRDDIESKFSVTLEQEPQLLGWA